MSLQSPNLKELKTELISVMDYFHPSPLINDADSTIVKVRSSTAQDDHVRRAMTANMFAQLLEIIGNRTPSDIETSALILKELSNLLDKYDATINPIIDLTLDNSSLISSVRSTLSDLTRVTFDGIPTLPINISDIPFGLTRSILSPFHPVARTRSIGVTSSQLNTAINNLIDIIWGNIDENFAVKSKPNLIRDFNPRGTETFGDIKYAIIFLDYLSQMKSAHSNFQEVFGQTDTSPHSSVLKKAIKSDEIGVLKSILFDLTTSTAKTSIANRLLFGNNVRFVKAFVTTDDGYEKVFRKIAEGSDLESGTKPTVKLQDWLNNTKNVLNLDVVASLRDGFLLDTSIAEEFGLDSFTINPIKSQKYISFTENTNKERNDIISKMKEIIISSDLVSGGPGDYVPGVSPASNTRGAFAFKNCNFVAAHEGLGNALTHQNCVALSGLFSSNPSNAVSMFSGAQRIFGKQWHLSSIRSISKYALGILTGKSVPNTLRYDPVSGETITVENADSSVQSNLDRASSLSSELQSSIEELESLKSSLDITISNINRGRQIVDEVKDFLNSAKLISPFSMDSLVLFYADFLGLTRQSLSEGHATYLEYIINSMIGTGYSKYSSVSKRRITSNNIEVWAFDLTLNNGRVISIYPRNITDPERDNISYKQVISSLLGSDIATIDSLISQEYNDSVVKSEDLEKRIETIENELQRIRVTNAKFIINALVDNFPFQNSLSLGPAAEVVDFIENILNSARYENIISDNSYCAISVNFSDALDPTTLSEGVESSGYLSVINSVLTDLIIDCSSRIQSMPNLSRIDITNYAYSYFMLCGALCRKLIAVKISQDQVNNLLSRVDVLENKILTPDGRVLTIIRNDSDLSTVCSLDPYFQKNYANTIGLGNIARDGQIKDPYAANLEYAKSVYDLFANTLAPGFSVAVESLLKSVTSLRSIFSKNISVGNSSQQIPLNIFDVLVNSADFDSFASKARNFIRQESLTSIALLSSNNADASLSLFQFALYALSQSASTKIDLFQLNNSTKIPYNKICAIGVHKNLEKLVSSLPTSQNTVKIKNGLVKVQIFERQFDPIPSAIDQLNAGPNEYLDFGSNYLQSTPSFGQTPGGFNFMLGMKLDYKYLVQNFTWNSPVIKIRKHIANPITYAYRDFFVNLYTGEVSEVGFPTLDGETSASIMNFIRSEALKIYYYFMTGLILEPEFAPDPTKDDSIITTNLISANPITRLKSLIDLFSSSDINIFGETILIPIVSDNDSIEEFSAKISFLT